MISNDILLQNTMRPSTAFGSTYTTNHQMSFQLSGEFLAMLLPPAIKCYVFTCVCDSVHRGSASVHAGIPYLPARQSPNKEIPLARRLPWKGDPPAQCMRGDTVNKQAVCILLECNSYFSMKWHISGHFLSLHWKFPLLQCHFCR